jgi:hypothetical protein
MAVDCVAAEFSVGAAADQGAAASREARQRLDAAGGAGFVFPAIGAPCWRVVDVSVAYEQGTDGMTDRDHFAAAALSGLMANPNNNDTTADTIRFWAWNWADAMLREREQTGSRPTIDGIPVPPDPTNHDAAPAARAEDVLKEPTGRSGGEPAGEPEGTVRTGDTQEPVAWAVMLAGGDRIYDVYAIEEDAKAIDEAVAGNHGIVPLYRQPALTAEECEAIELATYEFLYHQDPGGRAQWIRQQLLGLLARTK